MEQNVTTLCASCAEHTTKSEELVKSEEIVDHDNDESIEKCKQWLMEKCSLSDLDSEYSYSTVSVSSTSQSQVEEFSKTVQGITTRALDVQGELISEQITQSSSRNTYGDVNIAHSKHVVIGNVTYITGPVHITQNSSNIVQQKVVNQVFIEGATATQRSEKLRIITRLHWLAQPAFSKTPLQKPVKYVIIAHTATEEGTTQAENTLLVRLVQSFHIESCRLHDISYNFLVGSDGHVYQGRGWNLQGEHTDGFNDTSIAIAFVGCFLDHLPSSSALGAAKALIQHGIELGIIPENYTLLGQCQCFSTESPGKKLYEEIKTWSNWNELVIDNI